MDKKILHVSVMVNAPIAHVWSAITQPEQIKQYFFGTKVETDWKVGTPITFSVGFEPFMLFY